MSFSVSNNLSALNAFGTSLGVTANNIANVDSKNFEKSRAVKLEGENGSVRVDISKVEDETLRAEETGTEDKPSNVDLTEEIPRTVIDQSGYMANLKAVQIQEETLGTVLDIIA